MFCDWSVPSAYFPIKWKPTEKQRIYKTSISAVTSKILVEATNNNFCLTRVLCELTHICRNAFSPGVEDPAKYKAFKYFEPVW